MPELFVRLNELLSLREFDKARALQDAIDEVIGRHATGWRTGRLSRVSRAVLRYGTYELLYSELPVQIALNEAIVLDKKFDDPAAVKFVNGVLNAIKNEIEQEGKQACIEAYEAAVKEAEPVIEAEEEAVEEAAASEDGEVNA